MIFKMLSLTISLVLAFCLGDFAVASRAPVVSTPQGRIHGVTLPGPGRIHQFLGIPFAQSTAGSNRFRPPAPLPNNKNAVFDAISFGDSCPQLNSPSNAILGKFIPVALPNPNLLKQSEDCLSLNIWTPSLVGEKKAVMIWTYGGVFEVGTSNNGFMNGTSFALNQDVIVVSYNYRLNIFGSPNAPQLAGTPQNLMFLDMDMTVQWVFDNIESFGGDRERIVLFGQSAGAAAVDAYAFRHPNDTKVKGIISQSGTTQLAVGSSTLRSSNPITSPSSPWNSVANLTGCGTTNDQAQFKCMQSIPTQTLLSAVIQSGFGFSGAIDNVTLFSNSPSRPFLRVPLLTGTNSHEDDIFLFPQVLSQNGTITDATLLMSDVATNSSFLCPASFQARNRTQAGVPTYRYFYTPTFPNLETIPQLRAYHTSEIPLVFGTFASSSLSSSAPPTKTEEELSKFMQSSWATFAKDPANGLKNRLNWKRFEDGVIAVLGGEKNPVGLELVEAGVVDSVCG